ncbi:MAG: type II toxin-antitoxin system HigB family toxin [Alphaproteobacteria bacterium]|nr:type II toxin-antitoxin system HigB family toxin [Alphaproteobacteria bacterium]
MIVVGTEIVERYFGAHRGARGIRAARSQYEVWLAIARRARWRHPGDVKASHPRASILRGGRVVFASHAEYDRVDAESV